jgi:hypothetical protein
VSSTQVIPTAGRNSSSSVQTFIYKYAWIKKFADVEVQVDREGCPVAVKERTILFDPARRSVTG